MSDHPTRSSKASNMAKSPCVSDKPTAASSLRRRCNYRKRNNQDRSGPQGNDDERDGNFDRCGQRKRNRKKAANCRRKSLATKSVTDNRKWAKRKKKANYQRRTYLNYVKKRGRCSRNSKNRNKKNINSKKDLHNSSNGAFDNEKDSFSRALMTASMTFPYLTLPLMYPYYYYAYMANWCGVLNMAGFAKCSIAMEPIRGYCYQFSHLLEKELHVVGGIKRAAVWECLENIKKSGRKKVGVVLVKPASCLDVPAYNSYFEYFVKRRQIGHISYCTKDMSFFLLLPMSTGKKIKSILKYFQTDPIDLGYALTNFMLGLMLLKAQDEIRKVGPLLPPMLYPTYMPMLENPPLPAENPPEKPLEPE